MIIDEENYIIFIDEPNPTTTYVGKAVRGASASMDVWQIKKVVKINTKEHRILWADGDDGFNKVWNDRSTYTYK